MGTVDLELFAWVSEARARTVALVDDLSDEQRRVPLLDIVNPPQWEIGHVAWFQEKWVLRHMAGRGPFFPDADALYDSMAVPHDRRWELRLPSWEETLRYLAYTRDAVLARLRSGPSEAEQYFVRLAVFHEDMHAEALTYTRQTRGYSPPRFVGDGCYGEEGGGPLPGDVEIPGGEFLLGATPEETFVFDNEKWGHWVRVERFKISRAPVSQKEFAEFVNDGGYKRRELWSEEGWRWRERVGAEHPVYWRRSEQGWQRRHFDRWVDLEPHRPVIHVNFYEAEAYCRWSGRRLPTEVEWEVAASAEPDERGGLSRRKRRFPWGDAPPEPRRANLHWWRNGCLDVGALPESDSAFGCRQMIGNVWEWTDSTFGPYPGFVPDPYRAYSEPWFGTRKVLRGGCWSTPSRLIRNTFRNFFTPDRRDIWAGFRTCAR